MKQTSTYTGNFTYRELDKRFRLMIAPMHMEIVVTQDMKIPAGVWKLDTGIHIVPGYMQLIDCNGNPDLYVSDRLFVYQFIYTTDATVSLTIHAEHDMIIPAETTVANLTPFLAAYDKIEAVKM